MIGRRGDDGGIHGPVFAMDLLWVSHRRTGENLDGKEVCFVIYIYIHLPPQNATTAERHRHLRCRAKLQSVDFVTPRGNITVQRGTAPSSSPPSSLSRLSVCLSVHVFLFVVANCSLLRPCLGFWFSSHEQWKYLGE